MASLDRNREFPVKHVLISVFPCFSFPRPQLGNITGKQNWVSGWVSPVILQLSCSLPCSKPNLVSPFSALCSNALHHRQHPEEQNSFGSRIFFVRRLIAWIFLLAMILLSVSDVFQTSRLLWSWFVRILNDCRRH